MFHLFQVMKTFGHVLENNNKPDSIRMKNHRSCSSKSLMFAESKCRSEKRPENHTILHIPSHTWPYTMKKCLLGVRHDAFRLTLVRWRSKRTEGSERTARRPPRPDGSLKHETQVRRHRWWRRHKTKAEHQLTLVRRSHGDALRRELVVEVARVRLRRHLRFKGRHQLQEESRKQTSAWASKPSQRNSGVKHLLLQHVLPADPAEELVRHHVSGVVRTAPEPAANHKPLHYVTRSRTENKTRLFMIVGFFVVISCLVDFSISFQIYNIIIENFLHDRNW